MRAAIHTAFGSPDVLQVQEVAPPSPGPADILVEVQASAVTQGDRRLRAADFPGMSALPGRLMFGPIRPRNRVPGTMFAGRVVAVGPEVSRFSVGDEVFGSCDSGAHAELLVVPQDSAVTHKPTHLSFDEAAAVPYGAITALQFLRDHGRLRPGQKALIIGAAGGVGQWAVQLAAAMGAEVTAVCSSDSFDFVSRLGADHLVDYHRQDFTQDGRRYDLVLDTLGVSNFSRCKASLTDQGRYLSLHMTLLLLLQMAITALVGGRRAVTGVAMGGTDDMEHIRRMLELRTLQPVVAKTFPLDQVAPAHTWLEQERPQGCVVLRMGSAEPLRLVAS